MISRRALLVSAAPAIAGTALTGCATFPAPVVGGGINPAFVDAVILAVQTGCAVAVPFIPTVSSIANVVASLFGAEAVASVQLISGAVSAVANAICSAVPVTASGRAHLRRRLAGSSYAVPVVIGTTPQGVVVTGYHV